MRKYTGKRLLGLFLAGPLRETKRVHCKVRYESDRSPQGEMCYHPEDPDSNRSRFVQSANTIAVATISTASTNPLPIAR